MPKPASDVTQKQGWRKVASLFRLFGRLPRTMVTYWSLSLDRSRTILQTIERWAVKVSERDSFNNAHPEYLPMGTFELQRQDCCKTRIKVLDPSTLQITRQLTTFQPQT